MLLFTTSYIPTCYFLTHNLISSLLTLSFPPSSLSFSLSFTFSHTYTYTLYAVLPFMYAPPCEDVPIFPPRQAWIQTVSKTQTHQQRLAIRTLTDWLTETKPDSVSESGLRDSCCFCLTALPLFFFSASLYLWLIIYTYKQVSTNSSSFANMW